MAKKTLFLLFWTLLFISCNESGDKSDSASQAATTSDKDQVVITGTLAIDNSTAEVKDSYSFSNQEVAVKDESGKTIAQTTAGEDGSYVVAMPGQLVTGGSSGTGLRLNAGLRVEAIVTETKDQSVLGIRAPIDSVKSGVNDLGTQDLEKITAIRGQAKLDGARDHTGIVVYIPGTSFSARTDSSGTFLMTFLASGSYDLVFEKDGYLSRTVEQIAVADNETSLIDEISLKLSGGTSTFSVKKIGPEGLSKSKVVEFLIKSGDADRFKAGLEDEVPNLAYGAVPELFRYEFPEDGHYSLKMIFANADGFESVVTRNIIVDTKAPSSEEVLLADRTTLSSSHTNERVVIAYHITCDDIKKVAIIKETETPKETDFIWDCLTSPTDNDFHYLIPGDESSFGYQLWVMDAVGNISPSSQKGSIVFDNKTPNAPSFVVTDQTNSSSLGTDITTVNLSFSSCEDTAKVLFSESQTSIPQPHQFIDDCSTENNAFSYTFGNNIAGEKTIVAWAIDHAGNIGPISGTSSIILDQTVPLPLAFTLSDPTEETANYTNSTVVKVNISSCGDSKQVLLSETQTTKPSELDSGWLDCSTSGVEASLGGEGLRTVYLWTKDIGGNISETSTSSTINVDTSLPNSNSFTFNVYDSTSSSTSATNAQTVNYQFSTCNNDAVKIYLSESLSTPGSSDFSISCSGTVNGSFTFSNLTNETKQIYVWTKDIAGNISSNYKVKSIVLDTVKPSAVTGLALKDPSANISTYTNEQTLNYILSSCPSGYKLLLKQDQSSQPSEGASGWINCTTSGSWANLITSGGTTKTVYAWIKDAAGNVALSSDSTSITWDSTAPSNPSVSSHTSPLYITSSSVALSGTAEANSKISITGGVNVMETTTNGSGNWSATVNLNNNASHSLQLRATDAPGNISSITYFTVYHDTVAPTISNRNLDIRDNQVVISWQTNESSQTYLEWGTTTSYGNTVNPGGYLTTHSENITGLAENTIYYFRIRAIDRAGNTLLANENSGSYRTYILKTGILSGSETWNVTNTSYLLSGDVTVPAGVILTISPNVEVRFDSGRKIRVEGTLVARGTSGNEIDFIPHDNSATTGYWKSIDFVSGSTGTTLDGSENYLSGSIIEYANIRGAGSVESPVRAYNIYLLLNYVSISDVGSSYYAVLGDSAAFIYFMNSSISNASGGGLDLNLSSVVVENSEFSGINQYAVYADNMRSDIVTRVANSSFSSMGSKFLYFYSGVGGTAKVNNNEFYSTYSTTTFVHGKDIFEIKNNLFRGGRYGINLTYTKYNGTTNIQQNIFNNVDLPIQIKNWKASTVNISNNSFLNSGYYLSTGAISFDSHGTSSAYTGTYNINNNLFQGYSGSSGNRLVSFDENSYLTYNLSGNHFTDNSDVISLYNKRLSGATAIDATGNWWGTTNTSEIATQVYDNSDDSNLSSINAGTPLSNKGIVAPISYPTNIVVSGNGSGSISIDWGSNAESDLAGYRVYYDFDGNYPYQGTGATEGVSGIDVGNVTSYTLNGLPSGTIYIYVTAYDNTADGSLDQYEGKESWYSQTSSISVAP